PLWPRRETMIVGQGEDSEDRALDCGIAPFPIESGLLDLSFARGAIFYLLVVILRRHVRNSGPQFLLLCQIPLELRKHLLQTINRLPCFCWGDCVQRGS